MLSYLKGCLLLEARTDLHLLGEWVLTERPMSSRPLLRTAGATTTSGTPLHWQGRTERGGGKKSKGIVRRERNEDIACHGFVEVSRRGEGKSREEKARKFQRGEAVVGESLAPGDIKKGEWLKNYIWSSREQKPAVARLHLCKADYPQQRVNQDLIHTRHIQKILRDAPKTWETNLEEVRETEMLQADQEEWRRRREGEPMRRERLSSSSKGKKKKKKRRRKDKREGKGEEGGPGTFVKKRGRVGGKTVAEKQSLPGLASIHIPRQGAEW